MSVFVKPKLKALKDALAAKNWEGVQKNALGVLDFESNNYNARVFLALALFNLDKPDEAEETYKKAIEQSPSQPLARQGLASFYEKKQRWADYARELQGLMQLFEESQDAPKYAETLEKLLEVRRKQGTKEELIETLSLLLPSSPIRPLLLTLPPYNATAPTATNYPTVQRSIASPLPTLLELVSLTSSLETAALEAEVKKRRQRLGGPALTAEETRRQVQAEQLPSSRLPDLWRAVLDDPDAANDETLRRETERQLLHHLTTALRSLPSPFDAPTIDLSTKAKPTKSQADLEKEIAAKAYYRDQVEELAKGMVLINVIEPLAWEVVVEWGDKFGDEDVEGWRKERWDELRRLGELFPESGLGRIAVASHQRLLASQAAAKAAALPEGSEEEFEIPSAPSEDDMAQIIEEGLAKSPTSLVAHLLAAAFFRSQQEWEALSQIAEAGLAVLSGIKTDIGRGLPRSHRTLDSHLALALTYLAPPTRHLRALRLLETLLASPAPPPAPSYPDPSLLTAKAFVLQSSEKYAAALKVWDQVLALPAGALEADALTRAQSSRSWALHLSGSSAEAKDELEGVVASLDERKVKREKEREEKEKYRSKRGLEKPEGVEEGETEVEKEERAEAWWRLGECLWKLSDSEPDSTQQAYDAYISALRASPSYAPAFTSLGLYYRTVPSPPDWDRSSKCFQKAFELDPGQEVAAKYLAEEFAELGEWGLVEVIARRVVDGNKGKAGMGGKAAGRLAWAWKAIGGAELNSKKYPQAITAFQAALRGAPSDVSTWLKLGTVYRQSGKYVAALKVFVKALGLEPSSWFAKYAIADVQREIGLVEPAIKAFKEILVERPEELGVKVVLAETSLGKGLDEQRRGFMVRAEESLLEALEEAASVIEGGTATRVAWKIAAEALVGLGKIPQPEKPEEAAALVASLLDELEKLSVDEKIAGATVVTVQAVKQAVADDAKPAVVASALAVLAFKVRVLLETQNEAAIGSAWFDLGIAISNFRSSHLSSPFSTSSAFTTPSEQALQQAIKCLKYALHKEPLNSTFWNALGVLSFDLSPRLAQHCFIRSVEHNSRTAVPWTNLGLFYLVHGDEDLANQAFLKAQVLDPDWTAAWIGQATLADLAGHAVEASVLLEHAFTLPNTAPEADYAFASRAFSKYRASVPSSSASVALPLDKTLPSATEALSAPLFALTRYLAQKPEDHHAVHLSALMLEQVGDLDSACTAFEKAAGLLEELYEVDESPQVEGQFVIAQTNLGRVRLAAKQYEGAIEAFEAALSLLSIDEAPEHSTNGGLDKTQSILLLAECRLGSALAQLWLGDADAAKTTLENAKDEVDGSLGGTLGDHLSVALARVYWAEQDEDRALAALMDSPDQFNKKTAPLFLKRIFQAIAIATNDNAILEASSKSTLDADIKYDPGIARLNTLRHLAKDKPAPALFNTAKSLHAFPWATNARSRISHLLATIRPVSSAIGASPSLADDSFAENLGMVERLMRPVLPPGAGVEDATLRSRRGRLLGAVALAKGSGEDGEDAGGSEEEVQRWFDKALFIAPWDPKARQKWQAVTAALRK